MIIRSTRSRQQYDWWPIKVVRKLGRGGRERITGIIRFPPGLLLGKNMKRALASAGLPVELSRARGCCLFVVMRLDDVGDDVDGGHTCDDNGEDDLRVALTNDDVSGNNACYLDGVE